MKNIIKSITLLVVMCLSVTSCLLEDDNLPDTFNDGPNFISFTSLTQNLSAVATGDAYNFNINFVLEGPTIGKMNEDVSVTIETVSSSTALEGVHYTFGSKSTVLTRSQNYIGAIPITVITNGVVAPLQLTLELTITASTGTNVISNSKNSVVSLVYQCFADLTGTYSVVSDCRSDFTPFLTTIVPSGGAWRVAIGDGGFLGYGCTGNPGLNNGATITELCGDILPTNDLDYGSLNIGNITGGSWDAENGILTMNHVQSFTGNWVSSWTSTYTRQ